MSALRGIARLSLSAQVIIGLVLGITSGIFFGERIAFVEPIGGIFIGLLQMTVIPYIVVSLIAAIGRLTFEQIRMLATKGGGLILAFWAVILVIVALIPLGYPGWESASFYSTSMLAEPAKTDFLALYIPSNPFQSMADGVIPAIVLFCVGVGLATAMLEEKQAIVHLLDQFSHALMLIAQFVARLAPVGVFALTAHAAGTMGVEEFGRVQVFIATYVAMALILSFWVVPGLISALTPISFKDTLVTTRDPLVTAFATGSLLIVLPLLAEATKDILERAGVDRKRSSAVVDVVTPINFNIPNLGKLIALSFVLFSGWFAGNVVPLTQYPQFLASGLFSFFGEVVIALPFLLDLMNIPADMFKLFVTVDVFTGRFGTLLAGVHTVALSILVTASVVGLLKVRWHQLGIFLGGSVVLVICTLVAINLFFTHFVENRYTKGDAVKVLTLMGEPWENARVYSNPYLIDGLSFVVPDSKRRLFASVEQVRKQRGLKIGVLRGLSLYEAHIRRLLPDAEIIRLDSYQDFFFSADGQQSADALVTLAMIGSAYNLQYPSYTVVVPKPVAKASLALALPRNDAIMKAYIDNWLMLLEQSGHLQELYDYWVLGEAISEGKERWSVIRDVLGWVD